MTPDDFEPTYANSVPAQTVNTSPSDHQEGCHNQLGWPRICGRAIHHVPAEVDETPVCLMHSRDVNKSRGELNERFWIEVQAELARAEETSKWAHFVGFIFPRIEEHHFKDVRVSCLFGNAVFAEGADFFNARFAKEANFSNAYFAQRASFYSARFEGDTTFFRCIFSEAANFNDTFFALPVYFTEVTFSGYAEFSSAEFVGEFSVYKTSCAEYLKLSASVFRANLTLEKSLVAEHLDLWGATVHGDATFEDLEVKEVFDLRRMHFLAAATFRRLPLSANEPLTPAMLLQSVRFQTPDQVTFDNTDMSRALLHNCNMSEVLFTSSVRWGSTSSRSCVVLDEMISLEAHHAAELQQHEGVRDWASVAQIYRQLKHSYDSRLDYWTADGLHYGEMEMQRLQAASINRRGFFRGWASTHLSLIALYRLGSDYGNSYTKPFWWILNTVLVAALLFPLPGIGMTHIGASWVETYVSVWHSAPTIQKAVGWECGLLGKSVLTSIDVITFQRNTDYSPAYPWGRALGLVESLLTTTLVALFLLAIRRSFRR